MFIKNIISKRIDSIEASGIRKIFDIATKNKGDYINLSIGQPHFPTPKKLKQAAIKAIKNNFNSYSPTAGLPILKNKIANKLNLKNHIKAKPENIIVTSGTSGGLFLAFSALLDVNDEIILPDPYFVLYKQLLTFLGVKIKYLDTYPNFHINPEKLKKLVTRKTKAILLNSPNNPTGAVYSEEELRQIAQIAKKNNLTIISDEIYEKFDYTKKFFSIGSIHKNTLTLNGFSKSHSVTGWRIGYAHGPKNIIEAMNKLQQYSFVCAPTFAQAAITENINIDITKEIKKYKKNSDLVYRELKNNFKLNKPEGAFYAFIKIPDKNSNFIKKCLQNKLLIVPGEVFSEKNNYFRLSFATDQSTLKKGLEILKII